MANKEKTLSQKSTAEKFNLTYTVTKKTKNIEDSYAPTAMVFDGCPTHLI